MKEFYRAALLGALLLSGAKLQAQGSPIINKITVRPKDCPSGSQQGDISVSILGGISPYTVVLFEGGIVTQTEETTDIAEFFNINSDQATVRVTDNSTEQQTVSATIDLSPNRFASMVTISNTCGDANGFIKAGPTGSFGTGGLVPFRYDLVGPSIVSIESNDRFSQSIDGLLPGDYTLTLTSSDVPLPCNQSIISFTLVETEPVEIVSLESFAADTPDGGTITVTAQGGSGDYNIFLNTFLRRANTFTHLEAGTYTVRVTDQANVNCTAVQEIRVREFTNEIAQFLFDKHCSNQ